MIISRKCREECAEWLDKIRLRLRSLTKKRAVRCVLVDALDTCLMVMAGVTAFILRFDLTLPEGQRTHLLLAVAVWAIVKWTVFRFLDIGSRTWRFTSGPDIKHLAIANVSGSLLSCVLIHIATTPGFPRSVYIADCALSILFTAGARAVVRISTEAYWTGRGGNTLNTAIYGAGAAGLMLLKELNANPALGYRVCGLIDDDPAKQGLLLYGVRVIGDGDSLTERATEYKIRNVLIAIAKATGPQMVRIMSRCAAAKVTARRVPALGEGVRSCAGASPLRDVSMEDLLGREPISIDDRNVRRAVTGKAILVTGAAGSIGSELCHQIARFDPGVIVGLDTSETGIFEISREITKRKPEVKFVPVVGSVRDIAQLYDMFSRYSFVSVYHAAAYKHVPLMELQPFEAFDNNVIGTYNVARMAGQFAVREFVMISTDKAVNPTSIMGLTKRVAEIIVGSLQRSTTKYVSVRFGNVLGSSGSVVPIFRRQIAMGGPVTVTHSEMQRYFMSIPEAAQLVLQASTMGHGGEIFVLDMGEPVKIVDLARNMILLSGRQPDKDIKIVFTGVRPGEKLCEELHNNEEETRPTYHDKVRIYAGGSVRIHNLEQWIQDVQELCSERDLRLLLALRMLVSEYKPSSYVLQKLSTTGKSAVENAEDVSAQELSRHKADRIGSVA
jgi:FlaA1/EpsC-like NDP-sugar epimerase